MKRALFGRRGRGSSSPRPAAFALALAMTGAWALSGAARAGTLGEAGQERLTSTAPRRELSVIVIASARGAGTDKPQETLTFNLADGASRETSVAETGEGTDERTARTPLPGAPRRDLAFSRTVSSFGVAVAGWAENEPGGTLQAAMFREIGRELPPLGLEHGPSGPPAVALSVFMGRKNGDVFSSLHEEYAWRMKFKSMTLGLGFYREIAVGERARILPYVGVIRSSLSLRPSGLESEQFLHEYQMTVFCFGLPLVIGF